MYITMEESLGVGTTTLDRMVFWQQHSSYFRF